MLPLIDVLRARRRIAPYLRPTPLVTSAWLSDAAGARVSLKLESLQLSNSFKSRGAFNAVMARLERPGAAPARLVTASAGNHGRALAAAAEDLRPAADRVHAGRCPRRQARRHTQTRRGPSRRRPRLRRRRAPGPGLRGGYRRRVHLALQRPRRHRRRRHDRARDLRGRARHRHARRADRRRRTDQRHRLGGQGDRHGHRRRRRRGRSVLRLPDERARRAPRSDRPGTDARRRSRRKPRPERRSPSRSSSSWSIAS